MAVPQYVTEINKVLSKMNEILAQIEAFEKKFKSNGCTSVTFTAPIWNMNLPRDMTSKFKEYTDLIEKKRDQISRFLSRESNAKISPRIIENILANLETIKMKIKESRDYNEYIDLMIKMSKAMKTNITVIETDLKKGLRGSWGENVA